MATTKKAVTIRFQPRVYEKLKVIAESEKRSVTNLVEYLSEKYIGEYETKNGTINFSDDNTNSANQIVQNNHGGNNVLTAGNSKNLLAFV